MSKLVLVFIQQSLLTKGKKKTKTIYMERGSDGEREGGKMKNIRSPSSFT